MMIDLKIKAKNHTTSKRKQQKISCDLGIGRGFLVTET